MLALSPSIIDTISITESIKRERMHLKFALANTLKVLLHDEIGLSASLAV